MYKTLTNRTLKELGRKSQFPIGMVILGAEAEGEREMPKVESQFPIGMVIRITMKL